MYPKKMPTKKQIIQTKDEKINKGAVNYENNFLIFC